MADTNDMRIVLIQGSERKTKPGCVLVHCEDNKDVEAPETAVAKCPFVKDGAFESTACVLMNLVRWVDKYGIDGHSASELPRPCPYRDISYVFKGWDLEFAEKLFAPPQRTHFLTTMNVAEKYKITGLIDFMSIALGCKLRNNADQQAVQEIFGVDVAEHDEDIKRTGSMN
ncbi:hypothetical protein AGDE_07083 [Angomonas deanei]|nr:hypothetical protein AGDE_07083 [Angomonas deanei]|eukprot:EPY36099.1 hypothetical protein AGDE_07083 [Angomonas deanei]